MVKLCKEDPNTSSSLNSGPCFWSPDIVRRPYRKDAIKGDPDTGV